MLLRRSLSLSLPRLSPRFLYSLTGTMNPNLEPGTLQEVENYWKPRLAESLPTPSPSASKYYVLSMFPYPSGNLHMGHVRVYSISDAFAHYYRMQGHHVIHPMGWDAFGLPAENAAIENKVSPVVWTEKNIGSMKKQLADLGTTFDWDREVRTCDPNYYRWTQDMFLRLYKAGLVYQAESMVNWDPVDHTVLADEQVDASGRSWRSGAQVEKKPLKQWLFRTTAFSEDLYDGLEDPSLVDWKHVTLAQRNWIGKPNGIRLYFPLVVAGEETGRSVSVWTSQPELIHGADFVVLHPEHLIPSVYRDTLGQLQVRNPATGSLLPVHVTGAASFPHGSQAVLACPSAVQEHRDLADTLGIPVTGQNIVSLGEDGKVTLRNSGSLSGLDLASAREVVMEQARREGWGGGKVSSHIQDWLISRQRYWGTPIPVVHCTQCGVTPVPSSSLPVTLPDLEPQQMVGKGMSPLLQCTSWLSTTCPTCGGPATRETDTMDTFVDSSWYFLRYLDPHNCEAPFSSEAVSQMPVDLYIGGLEHAYLHLYFARFFTHFLHSEGLVAVKEPFSSLITQGMVKSRSYRVKSTTKYLREDQVYQEGGKYFEKESGSPVVSQWEKMSKSKYNGVDPAHMVDKYGCDTVRLMMLSNVGPNTERNWNEEESYPGVRNMNVKLWKLVFQAIDLQTKDHPELRSDTELSEYRDKLRQAREEGVREANFAYSTTRNLAIVIARVHSMITAAWAVPGQVKAVAPEYQKLLGDILILLAPMAPHYITELWECFRSVPNKLCPDYSWDSNVWHQTWPRVSETTNLALKVKANNKFVSSICVARWYFDTLTEEQAFELACCDSEVQEKVLPHTLSERKFIKYQDYEAILEMNYFIKEGKKEKIHSMSPEEFQRYKQESKEAKRLEKLAKKEARAKRKAEYDANLARKEKIMKAIPKYPNKENNK